MSYFTLSNGEKLYYVDKGQGPETLIMLHGWTSSHDIFLEPVERLQKQARCIIYDHRGHGGSKKANGESPTMETLASDLHEVIQGLSLSNITLLGWSMGAGVILNYVRIFGCDALKQIVLCDMTPKQINDEEWKLGLYQGRYTLEEHERTGGFGMYLLDWCQEKGLIGPVASFAVKDRFVPHGSRQDLLSLCGIDAKTVADSIEKMIGRKP